MKTCWLVIYPNRSMLLIFGSGDPKKDVLDVDEYLDRHIKGGPIAHPPPASGEEAFRRSDGNQGAHKDLVFSKDQVAVLVDFNICNFEKA